MRAFGDFDNGTSTMILNKLETLFQTYKVTSHIFSRCAFVVFYLWDWSAGDVKMELCPAWPVALR